MLTGQFKPKPKFTVPLVADLHPAITCLSTMVSTSFSKACKTDPLLNILIPSTSLMVAYRKLPNLMRILCSPDQNKFLSSPSDTQDVGSIDTGCRCMVCKVSTLLVHHLYQDTSSPFKLKFPVPVDLQWSTIWCANLAGLNAGGPTMLG